MVRPLSSDPSAPKYGRHLNRGFIAAADKNLVVLYAGLYRPTYTYGRGCYLLFDAASSSLSTIPGIPNTDPYTNVGRGAVIVAGAGGAGFFLAELLARFHPAPAQGVLCVWQSSSSSQQQWVHKVGRLPAKVSPPTHLLRLNMAFFAQRSNHLCWVDLHYGLLLCDLERHRGFDTNLDLSFVQLPYDVHRRVVSPQAFRTMGCVDGRIKFLSMDGFLQGNKPVTLTTWTLNLDVPTPRWTKDTELLLEDLWKDKTYVSRGLPRVKPMYPVLSTQQRDVVYLVIPGDVEIVDGYRTRRVLWMFSVDTRRGKVLTATDKNCPHPLLRSAYVLTTSAFSAYQKSSKYHQRVVEATEVEPTEKRMKFGVS